MATRSIFVAAASLVCTAMPAFAQSPSTSENLVRASDAQFAANQVTAFQRGISSSVANGLNGATLKSTKVPDFQLLATADDKVASLALSLDISGMSTGDVLAADQLSFTISSNLDDTGNAQIIGLNGVPNGTEIKISYTHFGTRTQLTGRAHAEELVAEQKCRASPDFQKQDSATACIASKYADGGIGKFVAKYNPDGLVPLLDTVMPGNTTFYGLEFAGNQANYKYLDRASFSQKNDSHFGFAATVFGGVLLGQGTASITGSFSFGQDYQAQGEVTLCQPLPGTIQTQCLTAKDGPPVKTDQSILSIELRKAFFDKPGNFASVAVAPKFSFDFFSDAYSIALPVYLAGDGVGKLRGGINAVYLNEKTVTGAREDSFTLGVFVGVPFSVFGR